MSTGVDLVASSTAGPECLLGASGVIDNAALLYQAPALGKRLTPESVVDRYGVRSRQWLRGSPFSELDLGVEAARRALDRAGLGINEIDVLITATSTPSRATSSLAGRMARLLGARCASFDIRAGGSAGLVAWRHAELWLSGEAQTALVVATEAISPWIDLNSSSPVPLLFADGAAALVLVRSQSPAGSTWFQTRTYAPAGTPFTVTAPLPPPQAKSREHYVFQDSDAQYSKAMESLRVETCQQLAPHAQGAKGFFPLAPSRSSADRQTKALGLDPAYTFTCLEEWGCPGAAAPLIALANQADFRPSQIALVAVGGGVHSAAMNCRINN